MYTETQLSRIARQLTLRRLEIVAITTTVVAYLLTVWLVGTTPLREANPAVVFVVAHVGWTGAGLLGVGGQALLFGIYGWTRSCYPRSTFGCALGAAVVGVYDLIQNLVRLWIVGAPETVLDGSLIATTAPVIVAGVVLGTRLQPSVVQMVGQTVLGSRIPSRRTAMTLALVLLTVTSLPAAFLNASAMGNPQAGGVTETGPDFEQERLIADSQFWPQDPTSPRVNSTEMYYTGVEPGADEKNNWSETEVGDGGTVLQNSSSENKTGSYAFWVDTRHADSSNGYAPHSKWNQDVNIEAGEDPVLSFDYSVRELVGGGYSDEGAYMVARVKVLLSNGTTTYMNYKFAQAPNEYEDYPDGQGLNWELNGSRTADDNWHSAERNLQEDLASRGYDVRIEKIVNFQFHLNSGYDGGSGGGTGDTANGYVDNIYLYSGATGQTVNGTVENQNGDPVPNATVRIMGVDKTKLGVDPSKHAQKADELLAEAENVTPPDWRPERQLTGSDGYTRANDTEYVIAHSEADWELRGREYGGGTKVSNVEVTLDTPRVQFDSEETIVLSVFDPEREAIVEDTVDDDLYGRTVPESRKVVVKQIGPGGDILDETTRETQPMVEIGAVANQGWKTHYGVTLNVGTGFYKVHPKGHPERSILVAKGDPQSMIKTWETDLEDQAGQASAKAQRLQELIQDQQKLQTWTVQTDENGTWSKDIPSEYITVAVTAYKGPYEAMNTEPQNATIQDIRTFYETAEYNGSVAIAPSPKKVSPPAQGVTITVIEQTTAPRTNVNVSAKLQDLLQEYLENRSMTDVSGAVQQALEDYKRSDLEETYRQFKQIIESNDRLQDRYRELLDDRDLEPTDQPPGEMSRDELETRTRLLEQAWYEVSSTMPVDETTSEVSDAAISAAMTVGEEASKDDVTVIAHYTNGTSTAVAEEYISVDSGVPGVGGSTVRVEDYPIGKNDPAGVTFEFRVANEDGVAKGRETVGNPFSNTSIPALKSISLSTLEPGPDEAVSIQVTPADDSTFDQLTGVTVYGPDGSEIATDAIEDGTESGFTTAGQGQYRIVLELAAAGTNQTFVEVVRMNAGDINRNADPTVRLVDTHGGVVPLVGDGIDEAEVKTNAQGDVTVAPTVSDDITELDVFVQSATRKESDITVRLLKPDGSSYRKSVGVRIHTTKLSDDAYVYRGKQPITSDGGAAGSRDDQADQTRIDTYTQSNGEVSIRTIEDPGRIQQAVWLYRTQSPFQPFLILPELPIGPAAPVGTSAGAVAVAGAGALARRRNWW